MTIYTRLNIPWTCPICRQSVAADVFHLCRPRGKPLLKRIAIWWGWNWPHLMYSGLIASIIAAIVMLVYAHEQSRQDFMAQCVADHAKYECELAWRQANSGIATSIAAGVAIGTIMGSAISTHTFNGVRSYAPRSR